jgi:hypothetical protein
VLELNAGHMGMNYLIDVFKGKSGLATTYWGWGIGGGIILTAGFYGVSYIAVKNIEYYTPIAYGYNIFSIIWGVFICIAIINSASYERDRGLWGWIATFLAVLGLIRTLKLAIVVFGLAPMSLQEFRDATIAENLALPMDLGDGVVLQKMSVDSNKKSLTYHVTLDLRTINNNVFDVVAAKNYATEDCDDYKDFLGNPVDVIVLEYRANDGTKVNVDIFPEDCGF